MCRFKKTLVAVLFGAIVCGAALLAHAPSGAIFTTLVDGSEVNFNQYNSKSEVYLDGGPGPGAPQTAAGLDDDTYVFQVTNPNGRTLLSTDPAECRQFTVSGGVIVSTAPSTCPHQTGVDIDHNAITVQLMPYDDTSNPGGVYKVWVTTLSDFLAGCAEFGIGPIDALRMTDCGTDPANLHGFIPSHSKTDNFKIGKSAIREIDTRFFYDMNHDHAKGDDEPWLDGLSVTWNDSVRASNRKFSYWAPSLFVFHEAHVEGIENGVHQITITDQPGCAVHNVTAPGFSNHGPATVFVDIKGSQQHDLTVWIDVACYPPSPQ
jgi:hypothetical protein